MRLISWNVNGLRAIMKKDFSSFLNDKNPDFLCIQETKMQEGQEDFSFNGYHQIWSSAEKKGYSGTLILAKKKPLDVIFGINGKYNDEGRAITLIYDEFFLVNLYSPNSQEELKRLSYRLTYEEELKEYLGELKKIKPVIVCGDLNVAHEEIDIKNPSTNKMNAGFTIEEREAFSKLLQEGFIDSFRFLYPDKILYSWWSYRFKARERNAGWRIDYFLVSEQLKSKLVDSIIHNDIFGSDHCPIELVIEDLF